MSALSTYNFESALIRVIELDGNPWFVAKDAYDLLGLDKSATRRISADEQTKLPRTQLGMAPGRPATIISESGLYQLVMRSDKPVAERFQNWVTQVILPAIRKDGGYIHGEEKVTTGEMSEDELVLRAVEVLQAKLGRVTAERDGLSATVTEHLEYMTVNEFIAHQHCYVTHGQKTKIGRAASSLCRERGLELVKQRREISVRNPGNGKAEKKETMIGVYPHEVLIEAVAAVPELSNVVALV